MGGKQRWREPLIRKMMSNPFIVVLVMYSWVLFNTDLLHTRRWCDAFNYKFWEWRHISGMPRVFSRQNYHFQSDHSANFDCFLRTCKLYHLKLLCRFISLPDITVADLLTIESWHKFHNDVWQNYLIGTKAWCWCLTNHPHHAIDGNCKFENTF
jgi:hypothetical protein